MLKLTNGKKTTPNQLAKLMVCDYGQGARDMGLDNVVADVDAVTEKEAAELDAAIRKQLERIYDFLGIDKVLG